MCGENERQTRVRALSHTLTHLHTHLVDQRVCEYLQSYAQEIRTHTYTHAHTRTGRLLAMGRKTTARHGQRRPRHRFCFSFTYIYIYIHTQDESSCQWPAPTERARTDTHMYRWASQLSFCQPSLDVGPLCLPEIVERVEAHAGGQASEGYVWDSVMHAAHICMCTVAPCAKGALSRL